MQVKEVDFQFRHGGRKYNVNLQIMKPFKTRMYRVREDKMDGVHDEVFIFYEVNESERRFFYFPMNELKRTMAASIFKELRNF